MLERGKYIDKPKPGGFRVFQIEAWWVAAEETLQAVVCERVYCHVLAAVVERSLERHYEGVYVLCPPLKKVFQRFGLIMVHLHGNGIILQ
jgi:hypothetical protein